MRNLLVILSLILTTSAASAATLVVTRGADGNASNAALVGEVQSQRTINENGVGIEIFAVQKDRKQTQIYCLVTKPVADRAGLTLGELMQFVSQKNVELTCDKHLDSRGNEMRQAKSIRVTMISDL
jgi:hypothetical protein